MMDPQPPGGVPVCSNEPHFLAEDGLFSGLLSENPQLITSLVLLARGSLARRHFINWCAAHSFSSAALHHLLMLHRGSHAPPPPGPPHIVRNPIRWIRSVCEHELLLLDLLVGFQPFLKSSINIAHTLSLLKGFVAFFTH